VGVALVDAGRVAELGPCHPVGAAELDEMLDGDLAGGGVRDELAEGVADRGVPGRVVGGARGC
jgi:hypothetical protein